MGVCAWNHFPSRIGRRCPHSDSFHCKSLLGRRLVKPYQHKGSTRWSAVSTRSLFPTIVQKSPSGKCDVTGCRARPDFP
jgi:hypothetical protein